MAIEAVCVRDRTIFGSFLVYNGVLSIFLNDFGLKNGIIFFFPATEILGSVVVESLREGVYIFLRVRPLEKAIFFFADPIVSFLNASTLEIAENKNGSKHSDNDLSSSQIVQNQKTEYHVALSCPAFVACSDLNVTNLRPQGR
ncbi:unnamed protein product [Albugo candida]|uniref:Uncharacterized protein n=1 Tax=Albugo candida TaxID=65357 RepID=A0A024FUF6_9STRA|nr:unnamed protein product [Albugo candida]|eukprot:CCI10522.1 unnamed protein product [Albugo candida]